jgi:hypothetical protein
MLDVTVISAVVFFIVKREDVIGLKDFFRFFCKSQVIS